MLKNPCESALKIPNKKKLYTFANLNHIYKRHDRRDNLLIIWQRI